MAEYRVHPNNVSFAMGQFSGGNQQKILLASRLDRSRTKVLILHEPTQGVDSGAKREILEIIQRTAQQGVAVLVFSSDHEELVNTCGRILVMSSEGRTATEIETAFANEDDVIAACIAAG